MSKYKDWSPEHQMCRCTITPVEPVQVDITMHVSTPGNDYRINRMLDEIEKKAGPRPRGAE